MNTLEKIIAYKRKKVEERKSLYPLKLLERSVYFNSPVVSLKKYLLRKDKVGVIAEFKRKSPSKGIINRYANVEKTTIGYMQSGATALSVLTDEEFFGGSNEDLMTARKFNYCPILRKDFIIDEYQLVESKSIGADAILLLASVLSSKQIVSLSKTASSLGMEVLLELHGKDELNTIDQFTGIIGVNNRNLKTFEVDIKRSLEMARLIPNDFVKVSESGIDSELTVLKLKDAGYNGFLMGEAFMKHDQPETACAHFIKKVNAFKSKRSI